MLAFEIIRTKEVSDRNTDFVALGNLLQDAVSYHSSFIIRNQEKLFEFHYTGTNIEYTPIFHDYHHKITDTILSDEVPAFIAFCKNIQKNANPKYGHFYSGESYDINGKHLCNTELGERMTCVGFCLNVLKGFLEKDYLSYSDWNSTSHDEVGYLKSYCEKHNLVSSKIKFSHRRITPIECLISGFFNQLPIKKSDIDSKKIAVEEHFLALAKIDEEK